MKTSSLLTILSYSGVNNTPEYYKVKIQSIIEQVHFSEKDLEQ